MQVPDSEVGHPDLEQRNLPRYIQVHVPGGGSTRHVSMFRTAAPSLSGRCLALTAATATTFQ